MITCANIENLDSASIHHKDYWKGITLSGIVEGMGTPHCIETGTKDKVCDALLRDYSGVTNLTLWGEDVDRIKDGYKIRIENGMVNEYKGLKRFSTGLFGCLVVLAIPVTLRPSNMPIPTVTVRNN